MTKTGDVIQQLANNYDKLLYYIIAKIPKNSS